MSHIHENDVVPALRSNLAFDRPPQGLGTGFLRVKNVSNGEEFSLRGFEVSLARMLDGRRTAAQVVQAAEQVGLPVTLEDLDGFVKRMEELHLVAANSDAPGIDDTSPFELRQPWDERTRKLFRLALREGRAGNLNRALVSLDCLLHERPDVEEAVQLREKLEVRKQAPESVLPFEKIFADTERVWHKQEEAEVTFLEPRDRKRTAKIVAGTFAALGALVLAISLIPFPHNVTSAATLLPVATAKLEAPRSGTIDTVQVAAGQWVDKGAVLFTYDVTPQLTELEAAVVQLGRLNGAQYAFLPRGKEVQDARARYTQAEAKLAAAQKSLENERMRDGEQVLQAEESMNLALSEIAFARQTLDAFVPEPQRAEIRAQRSVVQELELQLLESEVRAPISGAITRLGVQPGAEVQKGLGVAQIEDGRQLKGIAIVEPRDRSGLQKGQNVLLLSNGRATNTTIQNTSGRTVEILVDNQANAFQPGTAELQIRGNPVPLIR